MENTLVQKSPRLAVIHADSQRSAEPRYLVHHALYSPLHCCARGREW